jgi:hypothetical protein
MGLSSILRRCEYSKATTRRDTTDSMPLRLRACDRAPGARTHLDRRADLPIHSGCQRRHHRDRDAGLAVNRQRRCRDRCLLASLPESVRHRSRLPGRMVVRRIPIRMDELLAMLKEIMGSPLGLTPQQDLPARTAPPAAFQASGIHHSSGDMSNDRHVPHWIC